jgi:2-amino-4-hydroxy-6-hydroxymethyldihydropteridine diphosphokinase
VARTLGLAVTRLAELLGPLAVAPLYRSRAVGTRSQPDFLNTAVVGKTALPPAAVLAIAKALERAAGRRRGPRGAPRPLDLDLLLFGASVAADPELTLPHPRLAHRRFALAPVADLIPDAPVPPTGLTVSELLARLGREGADGAGAAARVGTLTPLV